MGADATLVRLMEIEVVFASRKFRDFLRNYIYFFLLVSCFKSVSVPELFLCVGFRDPLRTFDLSCSSANGDRCDVLKELPSRGTCWLIREMKAENLRYNRLGS